MLKVYQNFGFFSCCAVILYEIIIYFNKNYVLPEKLDTSESFNLYKPDKNIDIFNDFFQPYNEININIEYEKEIYNSSYNWGFQFHNYKEVDYLSLKPFINKYFTPSSKIINIYNELLIKYNIDIENCIGLYYRGTDKITETQIDSFDSYCNKLLEVIEKSKNNSIQILIQTDSSPFFRLYNRKLYE